MKAQLIGWYCKLLLPVLLSVVHFQSSIRYLKEGSLSVQIRAFLYASPSLLPLGDELWCAVFIVNILSGRVAYWKSSIISVTSLFWSFFGFSLVWCTSCIVTTTKDCIRYHVTAAVIWWDKVATLRDAQLLVIKMTNLYGTVMTSKYECSVVACINSLNTLKTAEPAKTCYLELNFFIQTGMSHHSLGWSNSHIHHLQAYRLHADWPIIYEKLIWKFSKFGMTLCSR